MAALAAIMLLEGNADYERGYNDAQDDVYIGPTAFALGSRYDEGHEDGKRDKEKDEG